MAAEEPEEPKDFFEQLEHVFPIIKGKVRVIHACILNIINLPLRQRNVFYNMTIKI